MNGGKPRDVIGMVFAAAIALLLALAIWPAIADAPPKVTIKPVAVCDQGKCTMSQQDYETLQKFHAERMAALMQAGELIDGLVEQNQQLLRQLARDAAGCKGRRT